MEVIYSLNERDVLAGMRLMEKHSFLRRRLNYIIMLPAILVPFFTFLTRGKFTPFYVLHLLIDIFLLSLLFALMVKPVESIIRRQALVVMRKRSKGILGEHKIFIAEDFLIESTPVSETHLSWDGVERVCQDEHYISIMISDYQGHIIPKRAFVNDDVANQFYEKASKFHQNSQQG